MGDSRYIYWRKLIDNIIDEKNKEDKHERKMDIYDKYKESLIKMCYYMGAKLVSRLSLLLNQPLIVPTKTSTKLLEVAANGIFLPWS